MSDDANRSPAARGLLAILRAPETGLAVAILAVVALIYAVDPGLSFVSNPAYPRAFFTGYNAQTLSHSTALYGFLAVGVAVVIVAGGIDLSIGSVVALAAVVAAKLMLDWLPEIATAGLVPSALFVIAAAGLTLLLARLLGSHGGAVVALLVVALIATVAATKLGLRLLESIAGDGDEALAGLAYPAVLAGLYLLGALIVAASVGGALALGRLMKPRIAAIVCAIVVGLLVAAGLRSAGLHPEAGDRELGMPVIAAGLALTGLLGLGIGAGHAVLINRFELPAFIATLATLAGLRSLATILSDNRQITVGARAFRDLGSDYRYTLPLFLTVAALLSLVMGTTVLGRHLYALGGNESAARLSGLPTRRLKTVAYAISGLLAALAGLLFCGNAGQANPRMGVAYELFAITAAVVGGCSLAGGVGSIRGTVLGLVLIQIVIKGTGLVVEEIDPSQIEGLVLGVVVVLAVGFNQRFRLKH